MAVASRDRRRAEAFAGAHGVERALDTYAQVVADLEVEAVYNPLANGLYAPCYLAAIAAGKHVLLASGERGELLHLEVRMVNSAPPPDDLRWSPYLAGGALIELGLLQPARPSCPGDTCRR